MGRCNSMVDLVLLGCGGGMPMPNRFLSSTILSYKGRKILIDCGEGTQVSMKVHGTGFKAIDIICITHTHGDHIVGLPGLLATIGNSGRVEPMTIIGPKGIKDVINGLRVIVPYLPYELNVLEHDMIPEDLLEDVVISSIELDHSSPCVGYSFYFTRRPKFDIVKAEENRVPKEFWKILQKGEVVTTNEGVTYEPKMVLGEERKGIKITITTDTRPTHDIPQFINHSDLFICEGTYGDDEDLDKAIKNKHMTFSEAANLALKGDVQELLLTHFSPAMNEPELFKENASNIFANTIVGEDGLTKSLSFKD